MRTSVICTPHPVLSGCECGDEPSGSVKCREYLDQLKTSQLLKKGSVHGTHKLCGLFGTKRSDKLQFILMALSSCVLVEQASTAASVFLLVNCLGGQWLWLCCVVLQHAGADMYFVYGFCNGNCVAAVVECWQHYPHHLLLNRY